MNEKERIRRLRNLGIIAHIDAGKTTTTERFLFFTGTSHKLGEVDDGTTVTDWMDQERERGITITSAVTTFGWRDHVLNLVDTPGHVDFTAEVQRSLRVLDGAIVVICGVGGVEPQSEKVWNQAAEYRIPRIVFVNKLDRIGADFDRVLADLDKKLPGSFLPLLIPVGRDSGYRSAIDLVRNRFLSWEPENEDDEPTASPIPDEFAALALAGRERLVEAAAAGDESLLDEFLEHGSVAPERLLTALRTITLGGNVHPVLCGSALQERGIRLLLDAAVDLLPSPLDVPPVDGFVPGAEEIIHRNPNPQISLAALVYKVMADDSRNRLCFTRIYSGTLRKGDKVWNPGREIEERVTRVYRMHANKKVALPEAMAGDIVALIGPKRTVTGDSLCPRSDPILLETIRFPEPVISAAIEPRSLADLPDLERALAELAVEDPTFSVRDDPDTGQKIVSGMGELHIEVLVERLARDFNVQARTGRPQVTYRETITRAATARGRFDREIADRVHRAEVELAVAPNERNAGFAITSLIEPESGPAQAPSWIEESIRDSLGAGPFAGYPLIDIQVKVTDADLSEDMATEIAVRGAAADAFQKAVGAAEVILLEPVVRLEVTVPDEYAGEVLRDLNARHAQVTGVESRGPLERAAALVPLAKMFGYATDLRSLTRGRGIFAMELSHFEPATETMERFRGGR